MIPSRLYRGRGFLGRYGHSRVERTARPPGLPTGVPFPMLRPHGNTNYNSLQMKLERRFQDALPMSSGLHLVQGDGLELQRNLGRLVGIAGLRASRALCPYTFGSVSDLLQLDNLAAALLLRGAEGLSWTILGGWEATSIITLTGGAPYRIWYGTDLWNQGFFSSIYVDRVDDGDLGSAATEERWFYTSAFVAPSVPNPDASGQRIQDLSLCAAGETYCHAAAQRADFEPPRQGSVTSPVACPSMSRIPEVAVLPLAIQRTLRITLRFSQSTPIWYESSTPRTRQIPATTEMENPTPPSRREAAALTTPRNPNNKTKAGTKETRKRVLRSMLAVRPFTIVTSRQS